MFQCALRALSVLVFLGFSGGTLAQEVLVQERPAYPVGDYVELEISLPADTLNLLGFVNQGVGSVFVRAESKGDVQKDGRTWTMWQIDVAISGRVLYSGSGFLNPATWSGHLKFNGTLYRMDTDLRFPLRVGDTFTNTLMESGPCPSSRATCMKVTKTEQCYGTRRVAQGIEYICDGDAGERTRYVVDAEFKWPVAFEVLN